MHFKNYILLLVFLFLCACAKKESKQFTLLSAAETGVLFSNDIKETDSLNYFNYPYMYMGGGVSTGDINNDGLIDIFFTANMKPNALYLNQGDFTFKDITTTAQLGGDDRWVTGSTMVDLNNDGYLDIYVSVSGKGKTRNNLLYINNGDLTFTESAREYGLDDNGHTTQSTFFDYDNDGDLDVYLANYPPTPFKSPVALYEHKAAHPELKESDILYRNDGEGNFTDVTIASGILNFGLSLSATAADVNGDGWKDIYVSNDFDSADYLYLNNKDGTFKEVAKNAVQHTSQYGMGADIADYNNDQLLDIAQVDMTPEDNRRSKANMASMNPVGFEKMVNAGLNHQYMQNSLQLNRGTDQRGEPIFSEVSRLAGIATTDWSWSILFADLDNDGWKDITISNGTRRDINNRDYFNTLKTRNHFGGVALSAEEIEKIPSEKVSNYIFKNNQDLTFTNVVEDWGWDEKTFSNGSTYADLDNDGDLDIVINNIDQPVSVYRNNNLEGNNYVKVRFRGSGKNKNALGAKVYLTTENGKQYQELTLTRGFQSSVAPELHFGIGQSTKISTLEVIWPDGTISEYQDVAPNQELVVAQVDAKHIQKRDLSNPLFQTVVPTQLGIDFIHTENIYDDYYIEPLLPHETSKLGSGVTVGDVNSDGLDDFYVGGAAGQAGALYVQHTEKGFVRTNIALWEADGDREDMHALFFDADGDLDLDLYVVSGGNEKTRNELYFQDRLYINDGQGTFAKAVEALPTMPTSGSRVTAGDYDADGDLDLFVGGRLIAGQYPWPTKSYLLENNGGIFKDVTAQVAPDFERIGMITDAMWTDFDANGSLDLVIVGEWTPVLFYSNQDGMFKNVTQHTGLLNTNGWWSSIAGSDFDGDGDVDYVVGNLGLNYKYKATPQEPFEVYADDFDDNRRKDIVLSYYNFGKLFPVRGKSCSSQQMPSLKKKFKDYSSFAIAEVTEVYGKSALDNAEIHYKAQTFASSYIENLGDGKFQITALPNEAQFSSVNRILVQDVDQDHIPDLVLGGNLYASEIETPRNDSSVGVFMKGDGKGGFTPIATVDSGLQLRGDVKDLAVVTIGKVPHIISVRNNETVAVVKIDQPLSAHAVVMSQ